MNSGHPFTEKSLRLLLDIFVRETEEKQWIIPLNPDNIKIHFCDPWETHIPTLCTKTIKLEAEKNAQDLFPCYIKELWHIKQKREHRWKYWFYRLFYSDKVDVPANEKAELAANWLYD